MRREQLISEINDLKKRQAIKNAQLVHIESTTNWQRELYTSTQEELFNVSEKLDKKMDEYYYVAKSEILAIDIELSKIQDSLMADPFNADLLVVQEKDAKGKRLEIWHEMKSVLWVDAAKYAMLKGACSETCQDAECTGASCQARQDQLTKEVRKEAHNG